MPLMATLASRVVAMALSALAELVGSRSRKSSQDVRDATAIIIIAMVLLYIFIFMSC